MSACWFVLLVLSCLTAFRAGRWIGASASSPAVEGAVVLQTAKWTRPWLLRQLAIALSVIVLIGWTWLVNHPSLASRFIDADVLKYLEGTASAGPALVLLGAASRRATSQRQRAFVVTGVIACSAFFLYGSAWMLQSTRPEDFSTFNRAGVVRQSQRFSCVPAACATALNRIGVPTTEAEMAQLTQTRWGTGATLVRALSGVNQRLASTSYHATIEQADWRRLCDADGPSIVLMRFESPRYHMATVLAAKPHVVLLADPAQGMMWLSREQFEESYTGSAILIHPAPHAAPSARTILASATGR